MQEAQVGIFSTELFAASNNEDLINSFKGYLAANPVTSIADAIFAVQDFSTRYTDSRVIVDELFSPNGAIGLYYFYKAPVVKDRNG